MVEIAEQTSDIYSLYQKKEYASIIEGLVIALDAKDTITFGPTYTITTSKGIPLEVRVFILPESFRTQQLILVVFNQAGDVVGDRRTWITERGHVFNAEGNIQVKKRGEGIATPIEMVHFHMLQMLANTSGKMIRYDVENNNGGLLQNKKNENRKEQDEGRPLKYPVELISKLEEEQQRWQALYGPQGKLGFDAFHEKRFMPQSVTEDIGLVDVVNLQAKEVLENGRKIVTPQVITILGAESEERMNQEKKEHLNTVVLPKLQNLFIP